MSLEEVLLVPKTLTRSALTFPIDYNGGSVGDPPASTVFQSQAEIDAMLADNGWTAFKHLQAAYQALPSRVLHEINFDLASGIHRPMPSQLGQQYAWDLNGKFVDYDAGGRINFNGSGEWEVVSSLQDVAINSVTPGGGNPTLNFTGTPFNGLGDLKGYWAVLDTGQVVVIHDHDDSNLYLLQEISPSAPTTVTVAYPKTILRNSLDDIAFCAYRGASHITQNWSTGSFYQVEVNDITLQWFHWGAWYTDNFAWFTRCLIDCITGGQSIMGGSSGPGFSGWGGYFTDSSMRGTPTTNGPGSASGISSSLIGFYGMIGTFFGKGEFGLGLRNCWITMVHSVMDGCGGSTTEGFRLEGESRADCYKYNNGLENEIRNVPTGMHLIKCLGGGVRDYGEESIWFKNISNACCRIGSYSRLTASINLKDGGGNTGVGIKFAGVNSEARIDPGTDVTGSGGDIRFADGSTISWEDLQAFGPYNEAANNSIEWVTSP